MGKIPFKNFFTVPNMIFQIDDLTVYEKWVLLYIIRHTWGFHEYDVYKTITVDEFMNGRKLKNGGRIDSGCGVSRGAVSNALNSLESKGYIAVETDDSDAARVKKSYMLLLLTDNEGSSDERGVQEVNARVHQVNPYRERHSKDTIERQNTPAPSNDDAPPAVSSDINQSDTPPDTDTDTTDSGAESNWQRAAAFAHYFVLERPADFDGADSVPKTHIKRGLVIEKLIRESYDPVPTCREIGKFAEFHRLVNDYSVKAANKVAVEFDRWRQSGSYNQYLLDIESEQRVAAWESKGQTDNPHTAGDLIESLAEKQRAMQDKIMNGDDND